MIFQVIASGSNGNCAVISDNTTTILIDAGISRSKLTRQLKKLGITNVDYILITHAHSDHISGLPVFYTAINFRVIATLDTINKLHNLQYRDHRYATIASEAITIEPHQIIELGNFFVTSYPTNHDIEGSCSYMIKHGNGLVLSYITDTGTIYPEFLQMMEESHIIVVESNFDKAMLMNSSRPYYLKIRSRKFHMDNNLTNTILKNMIGEQLKVVFFAHLSGECNNPEIVASHAVSLKILKPNINWVICRRDAPSSLCVISPDLDITIIGGMSDLTYSSDYNYQSLNIDLKEFFD